MEISPVELLVGLAVLLVSTAAVISIIYLLIRVAVRHGVRDGLRDGDAVRPAGDRPR